MNRLPWRLVLISLIVLSVGCGSPATETLQAEPASKATPTTVAEKPVATSTLEPKAERPTATSTSAPTAQEPTATATIDKPTATKTPVPATREPTPTSAPPTEAPAATPPRAFTAADVQRITPAEAQALLASSETVLYDVRSAEEYRQVHAAGALSYPDDEMAERYGELPVDQSLIFY